MPTNPRDLIAEARKQSAELAREGVNGTPNLLAWIADALEAALADTERLDWLLERCSEGIETPIYESLTGWRCVEPGEESDYGTSHETARAAIDAARKGKP